MTRVGILISGRGSNMRALIDAATQPGYPAKIVCVIANVPTAGGLEVARGAGVPAQAINDKGFADKATFELALDEALRSHEVDLICLAGFMRLLSADFVNRWHNAILNIHPSLLPAYKGLNTHARAIADGVPLAGCTVHVVRPAMDDGPIIAQAAVRVRVDDTPDSLASRVLMAEHQLYPLALELFASGKVSISGERVVRQSGIPASPPDNPDILLAP